jgi:hypothetical protein
MNIQQHQLSLTLKIAKAEMITRLLLNARARSQIQAETITVDGKERKVERNPDGTFKSFKQGATKVAESAKRTASSVSKAVGDAVVQAPAAIAKGTGKAVGWVGQKGGILLDAFKEAFKEEIDGGKLTVSSEEEIVESVVEQVDPNDPDENINNTELSQLTDRTADLEAKMAEEKKQHQEQFETLRQEQAEELKKIKQEQAEQSASQAEKSGDRAKEVQEKLALYEEAIAILEENDIEVPPSLRRKTAQAVKEKHLANYRGAMEGQISNINAQIAGKEAEIQELRSSIVKEVEEIKDPKVKADVEKVLNARDEQHESKFMASVKKLGSDLKQVTFNSGEKQKVVQESMPIKGEIGKALSVAIVLGAEYSEVGIDVGAAGVNGIVGVYNAIKETKNKLAIAQANAALPLNPFNKDGKLARKALSQQQQIKKLENELASLVKQGDDIVQQSYEDIQKIRESNGK